MISTITNDRDEQRHIGGNALQHQGIYDGDRLTQVKTYTDHGNGYGQRSGGTTHYSKVINQIVDKSGFISKYEFLMHFVSVITGS